MDNLECPKSATLNFYRLMLKVRMDAFYEIKRCKSYSHFILYREEINGRPVFSKCTQFNISDEGTFGSEIGMYGS